MTPSNPSNGQPLIYRIMDALGVTHLVACINHTHSQSEVDGLSTALANKQDKLTFDSAPTAGSNNPVTSGGIRTALDGKANLSHSHDEITDGTAGQQVSVKCYGGEDIEFHAETTIEGDHQERQAILNYNNMPNLARALANPDSTPTDNSDKLVTSGGVKTALDGKQDTLTFDSTPTASSTNPVTSGGIKTALDGKQDTLIFDQYPDHQSTNPVTSGGVYMALTEKVGRPSSIQQDYMYRLKSDGTMEKTNYNWSLISMLDENPFALFRDKRSYNGTSIDIDMHELEFVHKYQISNAGSDTVGLGSILNLTQSGTIRIPQGAPTLSNGDRVFISVYKDGSNYFVIVDAFYPYA